MVREVLELSMGRPRPRRDASEVDAFMAGCQKWIVRLQARNGYSAGYAKVDVCAYDRMVPATCLRKYLDGRDYFQPL